MGADIYLKSVSDKARAEREPEFSAAVAVRDSLTCSPLYDPNNSFKVIGPPEYVEAQRRVNEAYNKMHKDGYFRDSYNSGSLFWLLGLSWWTDVGDRLDDEGNLNADGLAWLKTELETREVPNEVDIAAYFQEKGRGAWGGEGEENPKELCEYYERERQALIALVSQAQELGEPLYCSV